MQPLRVRERKGVRTIYKAAENSSDPFSPSTRQCSPMASIEEVKGFDDELNGFLRASSETSEDIVELDRGKYVLGIWKARLFPNSIVVARSAQNAPFVSSKREFELTNVKQDDSKGNVSARLKLGKSRHASFSAKMTLRDFHKLQSWMAEEGSGEQSSENSPQRAGPSKLTNSPSLPESSVNPSTLLNKEKIRFRCPNCLTTYAVAAKHAGKSSKCSNCSTNLRIPG